jgi:hypothetical protein
MELSKIEETVNLVNRNVETYEKLYRHWKKIQMKQNRALSFFKMTNIKRDINSQDKVDVSREQKNIQI